MCVCSLLGTVKLEPGEHVTANVRLLRPLGEGGMGAVWVADHLALGTEVAVKFLQGDYANDPSARARFSQEAAASSQVKSAHVVKIYDYGITDSQTPFIVMELLEGTDLAERIKLEGRLATGLVATVISQLCKALERAHEKHVIHRDIKPENIFLTNEGGDVFVKLLDFGIAKTENLTKKTTGRRQSTMAGESLGTPYYMSPEQFRNSKQIDHRTDLWSVGIVAYEALTGTLPFVADTVSALAIIVNEAVAPPPSVLQPSLPSTLDAWFAKACARDAASRFQSARELADELGIALGFATERASRVSMPTIGELSSSSQRIVIERESDLSLRDTAFATSNAGGPEPQVAKKKSVAPFVGAALVLAAVFGVAGVWLGKSHDLPDKPSPSNTVAATPPPSSASPPMPSMALPTIVASTTVPTASATASVKPVTKPIIRPTTSSAPVSSGGKHDEIW